MIMQYVNNSCEAQYFIDSELEGKYLLLIARHAEDPPLYSCYDVCVPLSVCMCE